MEFTLSTYKSQLTALQIQGYTFQTFENFLQYPAQKAVVLRHDIDKLPGNALKMAQLENELGIRGSYFFRVVSGVWDEAVMGQVVKLGHELGYHYENLSYVSKKERVQGFKDSRDRGKKDKEKLYQSAIEDFERNLEEFRKIYPVKTICMHGSPLSKWDNRELWEKYDYRDYGIIGEPYFDIDFNKVLYLTDTGRKWNNGTASIRDKVNTRFNFKIKNTEHLIQFINSGELPDQIMINTHPQRWFNPGVMWWRELILQSMKNVVKKLIVSRKDAKALR